MEYLFSSSVALMPCLLWNSLNVNNHFCSGIKCFIADCMLGLTYGSMMLVMLFILIITLYSSIVELRNQLHDWFHISSIASPCIASCLTLYSFCNSAHRVTALVIIFLCLGYFFLFHPFSLCSEVSLFWISNIQTSVWMTMIMKKCVYKFLYVNLYISIARVKF